MKARNFDFIRPESLPEAYQLLAAGGGDAVPIAGGQSLLAGLNMRLSSPRLLVDIAELPELRRHSYNGRMVELGALTRHRELLTSEIVATHVPLLRRAAPYIGHVAIRNRGTIGGSLAYADPAAELPACAVALGATLILGSAGGEREVRAEDFFKGLFETDLRPGELIVAVRFPDAGDGTTFGFSELARRHGDFALVGLAATATVDHTRLLAARFVYFGCSDRPTLAKSVSALVSAAPEVDPAALSRAIREDLFPEPTAGLRPETRLHMADVITRRVIASMTRPNA